MFGYVKTKRDNLRVRDWKRYRELYCLLCKNMGRYSQLSRMFLSYDMVFFMIMASTELPRCTTNQRHRNCLSCHSGIEIDYWACMSVLMIYYKIDNDVQDGEYLKKVLLLLLKRGKTKCEGRYPEISETICTRLNEIAKLEKELCSDVEIISSEFAKMLRDMTRSIPILADGDEVQQLQENISYWVAKWIYVIDAYDDISKDRKKGDYNPFILYERYHNKRDTEKYGRIIISHILDRIKHYCALYPYSEYSNIVQNILMEGIPSITSSIIYRTGEVNSAPA